ncbi:MAG: DUF4411 family protein [Nanoarchaeota archaeon]|nr:DUF4411 family protein [Nanoarchaeota archaeon]
MTNNVYIIDTCSLIDLNIHNPIDVYPSVWERLDELIKKGLLVAPKEVFNEIKQQDDNLLKWVRGKKGFFKEVTQEQIRIVTEILQKYPSLIKVDRKYDADPFVIALAVEMASNNQTTLINIKRIVVTEEKLAGLKVKIPLICKDYNIDCINVIDMFRSEGIKF